MKKNFFAVFFVCTFLLTACDEGSSNSVPQEMQYIKTSMFYDTVTDMYNNPDHYLGGNYHFVGELYSMTNDAGDTYYSIYGTDPSDRDCGIGIELKWDDFSGIAVGDSITVEGTLDTETETVDDVERTFLILRPTLVEKRDQ